MQGVMTVTVTALINGETRSGACDDTETTSSTPECRDLNKALKDVGDYYSIEPLATGQGGPGTQYQHMGKRRQTSYDG